MCFICFLCLVCLLCRGLRRSRPSALPSIAYRGFAIAPSTLRAPSRSLLYNPGCRVATLLVSKGVMGFLGDLRGRNSKSPPNPLGLAERVLRPQRWKEFRRRWKAFARKVIPHHPSESKNICNIKTFWIPMHISPVFSSYSPAYRLSSSCQTAAKSAAANG